jgi:hypothetical protein
MVVAKWWARKDDHYDKKAGRFAQFDEMRPVCD